MPQVNAIRISKKDQTELSWTISVERIQLNPFENHEVGCPFYLGDPTNSLSPGLCIGVLKNAPLNHEINEFASELFVQNVYGECIVFYDEEYYTEERLNDLYNDIQSRKPLFILT
jgi:hypothetical protein